MNSLRPITALAACAAAALLPAPLLAQRQPPPTPEQRLERLERQLDQVQRQVFPRGRPADTAGFGIEPAATQASVVTLSQRIDALERQMADILRQSEENGHQLRTIRNSLASLKSEQDERIAALEQRIAAAAVAPTPLADPFPNQPGAAGPATRPSPQRPVPNSPSTDAGTPGTTPATDVAEDAYTEGFKLWESGRHDAAINSLRAFLSAYPNHRRASFARNLIGRALLDKGEPRAAAEALLSNYRSHPNGERAADSLYYLGQALMQLGQPAQACKAYAELNAVYGAKVRTDLKQLVQQAQANASCS